MRALPAPELGGGTEHRGARTPQEELLCGLFAQVLGIERVGIDASFFALGGDSIMSIQLVSRARAAGLAITPRAVFQHQTVAALAASAGPVAAPTAVADDAVGALPATPIMRWLQEQGGPIDRFNQAMLLQVPAGLRLADLTAALQRLLDHHDVLRLRLTRAGGAWDLEVLERGSVSASSCLRRIDISGLDGEALRACVDAAARAAEERLAPAAGAMVQAVWLDGGPSVAGRLLLLIHHLAVDGVSWRILVPDLAAAWAALAGGGEPALAARGTSFRRWSQLLASAAQEERRVAEVAYWRELLSAPSVRLVEDGGSPERGGGQLQLELPADVTGALLTRVPAAFHGGINEVLLTGLVLAVLAGCRREGRGGQAVLVELEGHGREEGLADVDLTRTVGWFTSQYPVRLDAGGIDLDEALGSGAALGRALKSIKEQLRSVPEHGLGYGLLRYLNGRTSAALAGLAQPQIGFNYLGRFASAAGEAWGIAPEAVSFGGGEMPLSHALEINAVTVEGASGAVLRATWSWRRELSEDAVRALAQGWFAALTALVRHVEAGGGGRSPSDVALAGLSQAEIERLEGDAGGIEDILPLTPLQEGLLFHALYDAHGPDVYTVQQELGLEGELDAGALAAAAQAVVDRHASLRACFRQAGLRRPVQVIVAGVGVPWRSVDLSRLEEGERSRPAA